MVNEVDRIRAREKRHAGVRARVVGSAARPRLCVFRSLSHIYVQAVDDVEGRTVATASTLELRAAKAATGNVEAAKKVGTLIAERLKEKGLEKVVFDRGGYPVQGPGTTVGGAGPGARPQHLPGSLS